jgi:hypothetical protein
MSDGDSENITKILERDSATPPEKRIKFQDNQNAGRIEMSPSCAFDVYLDAQFNDSSQRLVRLVYRGIFARRVQKIIIKHINYFTNRYN